MVDLRTQARKALTNCGLDAWIRMTFQNGVWSLILIHKTSGLSSRAVIYSNEDVVTLVNRLVEMIQPALPTLELRPRVGRKYQFDD